MKFTLILTSILGGAIAFHVPPPFVHKQRVASLKTSDTIVDTTATTIDVTTTVAKAELLETAQDLNDQYGCLIIDSAAQDILRYAVEQLEGVSEFPNTDPSGLVGNWTLLCSTASATIAGGPLDKIGGIDTSRIPFFNEGPLKEIRDRINKSLTVQQIIKKAEKGDGIDRIDHVLQYQPPATLSEFVQNLPDAIKSLNINPLKISESKVILAHKAELESVIPVIKIKLSLSSIIVNIAGKSQILDPEGADILGINVPFGEFLNAGHFNTTYMDDTIRISRSKVGILDQLRVFVRSEAVAETTEEEEDIFMEAELPEEVAEEEEEEEEEEGDNMEAPSDVE